MKLFSLLSIAGLVCGLCLPSPAHGQGLGTGAPLFDEHGQGPTKHNSPGEVPALPISADVAAEPDYRNAGEPLPPLSPEIRFEGMNVEEPTCPPLPLMEMGPPFETMAHLAHSDGIMQSLDDQIAQLPPVFVHHRQTVRVSDRTAEIWVKLPRDSQSSVSVNFVEHPPEGDFRIFRTRINTLEPRRFYLSAKRWDVHANHWTDLAAVPTLYSDETPDLGYIELGPGQRQIVTFTDCQPLKTCVDVPSLHARLTQIEADIFKNHTEVKVMLGGTDTPLAGTTQEILQNTSSIGTQVAVLQQTVAPHDKSYGVTKAFYFDTTEKLIAGKVDVDPTEKRIQSLNWGSHPDKLNIIAASVPRALPKIPFTAQVTFMIQAEGQAPFATLASIPIVFHETAVGFQGEVDFNVDLAAPLANAFDNQPFPMEDLQLAAMLEFQLDHGELGFTRVSGELGNKIELRITQKAEPPAEPAP